MLIINRPIAITDIETTGFDADQHEIIEIGLVVVDQKTLKEIDSLNIKVRPEHLDKADPRVVTWEGWPYNEAEWQDAVSLEDALKLYAAKTENAIFCSHNITLDWSFITAGFKKTGLTHTMDYHSIDLFTLAWGKLRNTTTLDRYNLKYLAEHFGLKPEPMPHRAINGARTAYHIYKKLIRLTHEKMNGT